MSFSSPIWLLCIAAGAATLMIYAGLAKRALELKRPPGRCLSCGRPMRRCRCR